MGRRIKIVEDVWEKCSHIKWKLADHVGRMCDCHCTSCGRTRVAEFNNKDSYYYGPQWSEV